MIVAKIYADWCGHCKTFHPIWKKIKKANKDVTFYEFEASESLSDLETKIGKIDVQGYPTILKYDGKIEYFEGERTFENINNWIHSKKGGMRKKRKTIRKNSNRKNRTRRV